MTSLRKHLFLILIYRFCAIMQLWQSCVHCIWFGHKNKEKKDEVEGKRTPRFVQEKCWWRKQIKIVEEAPLPRGPEGNKDKRWRGTEKATKLDGKKRQEMKWNVKDMQYPPAIYREKSPSMYKYEEEEGKHCKDNNHFKSNLGIEWHSYTLATALCNMEILHFVLAPSMDWDCLI